MTLNSSDRILDIGTDVGGYRITHILGQGGFGVTYAAETAFGEKVALKQFLFRSALATSVAPEEVAEAEKIRDWALKSFRKTVFELKKLDHPNIVKVLHFIPGDRTAFLVMELVEGVSLDRLLRERGVMRADELKPYILPVLDALDYVHAQNRIHRDIAPDNIMIRADGTPVLIDFGSVKQIVRDVDNAETEAGLTRVSQVLSYPVVKRFYSPPEQYRYGGDLTPAADVYSVAAVVYRALTGRPPADAQARLHGAAMQGADAYAPAGLDGIGPALDRALALRVDERTQTIGALKGALGWDDGRPQPGDPQPGPVLAKDEAKIGPSPVSSREAATEPVLRPLSAEDGDWVVPVRQDHGMPIRRKPRRWLGRVAAALLVAFGAGSMILGVMHEREHVLLASGGDVYRGAKDYLTQCRLCFSRAIAENVVRMAEAEDLAAFQSAGEDPAKAKAYADTCKVCAKQEEALRIYRQAQRKETPKTIATSEVPVVPRPKDADRTLNAEEAADLAAFEAIGGDPVKAKAYADSCQVCRRRKEALDLYNKALSSENALVLGKNDDPEAARKYLRECRICAFRFTAEKIIKDAADPEIQERKEIERAREIKTPLQAREFLEDCRFCINRTAFASFSEGYVGRYRATIKWNRENCVRDYIIFIEELQHPDWKEKDHVTFTIDGDKIKLSELPRGFPITFYGSILKSGIFDFRGNDLQISGPGFYAPVFSDRCKHGILTIGEKIR